MRERWKQMSELWSLFTNHSESKTLELTKSRAFADNKLNVAKIGFSLFDRVENTAEKGENAGYQHFLLSPQCFPNPSSLGLLKVGIVWEIFKVLRAQPTRVGGSHILFAMSVCLFVCFDM